jgi:hypothetical protein
VWTFPLRVKSDTFSTLSIFFIYVSTQFGRTIKVVQCDNGHEFDNASSRTFFDTKGVLLRISCPYTSLQNGKAERILHTINNMLCSLLFQASILAHYWVEGLHTVTYLLNRLPTKAISTTSPYFTLHGVAPPMSTCVYSVVPAILISLPKPPTNWHLGPPNVFSSDTPLTTKVIVVLISPPPTSSSLNTLCLVRQISPSLPRPI